MIEIGWSIWKKYVAMTVLIWYAASWWLAIHKWNSFKKSNWLFQLFFCYIWASHVGYYEGPESELI